MSLQVGDDGIEKKKNLVVWLLLIRKFSILWVGDDDIEEKSLWFGSLSELLWFFGWVAGLKKALGLKWRVHLESEN